MELFSKGLFYKNNEPQICAKIKDNLGTIPSSFLIKIYPNAYKNAKGTNIENIMFPYQHAKSKISLPYIYFNKK